MTKEELADYRRWADAQGMISNVSANKLLDEIERLRAEDLLSNLQALRNFLRECYQKI